MIEEIESDFGKMKVATGNQHTFVGINFNLNLKGKVIITMKDYIKECVYNVEYITVMIKHSKTPVKHKVFEVNANAE